MSGDSTRCVHAGLPASADGEPFLPGPVFAAPYHLSGPSDASAYGYGRYANPTWTAYESALGELEGGETIVFASGMAAAAAVLLTELGPGDAVVVPGDGYYNVRALAQEHLAPRGVEVRAVATGERELREAAVGAKLVWAESPSNPGLDVLDIAALARDVHAAGALLAIDNTLAGPLRVRPVDLGADWSMTSASKSVTGHSDLVLGYVACSDAERAARLRSWRGTAGAIPGPFEIWLAHRSLATYAVRLERQEDTARALADALREDPRVTDVRWPGMGAVVCFSLDSEQRAQRFLGALEFVGEATSFGGVHSSAERRARWGTDVIAPGFIRFSAGIEDTADVVTDVLGALGASA